MSDSLSHLLLFLFPVIFLSVDSCRLPAAFMKCPIAGDLPPDRLGCQKDPQNRAIIACPKNGHSCLAILNANNTAKLQTLTDGLCIRNSDNSIVQVVAYKGKYKETQYEKSYFQWENPCFTGSGEYVVDSNHARRNIKVCCSGECTEKDPTDWAKNEKVKWVPYASGICTGFFAFLLTCSVTHGMYKKRTAKYLILKVSQSK